MGCLKLIYTNHIIHNTTATTTNNNNIWQMLLFQTDTVLCKSLDSPLILLTTFFQSLCYQQDATKMHYLFPFIQLNLFDWDKVIFLHKKDNSSLSYSLKTWHISAWCAKSLRQDLRDGSIDPSTVHQSFIRNGLSGRIEEEWVEKPFLKKSNREKRQITQAPD